QVGRRPVTHPEPQIRPRPRQPSRERKGQMTTPLSRRSFIAGSAALAAATYAGAAARPNDRIRLAFIGVHGRRTQLLRGFAKLDDVEVTHIIAPDENVIPPAMKAARDAGQKEAKTEKDVRRVLEDASVTAVVIAAPDHWHALGTVWACQAGKHVYVEKPVSHNLIEGRKMVE